MEDQLVVKSRFLAVIIEGLVRKWVKKKFGMDILIGLETVSAYTNEDNVVVHIDTHIIANKNEINSLIDKCLKDS